MTKNEFNIPIYDFKVIFVEIEGRDDVPPMRKLLKRLRCSEEIEREVVESIENEDRDGGYTLTSLGRKIFCVVILPQSSEEQRLAVIDHEKRHIEDDLLEHCAVTCKEASAYLAGYLTRCFYRFTHH